MNWRRGILRVWLVLTVLYVPGAIALMGWTTVDVQGAAQDRVYAELDLAHPRFEPTRELSFLERVRGLFEDAREEEAAAREMTLEELLEFVEVRERRQLVDYTTALQRSLSLNSWTWAGVVLAPPMLFLGLARALIWALEGFTPPS